MLTPPLVSCIMPTRNRREFVKQSLAYFQRQTFKDTELIVLDDGEDSVADLCTIDARIRYIRSTPVCIGTARNLACEAARGSIIVHWDDDDWQAPVRIQNLLPIFAETQARLIGLRDHVYLKTDDLEFWVFHFTVDAPWVVGNTMAYLKPLWKSQPFPDQQIGEDNVFCERLSKEDVYQIPNNIDVIGIIHPKNTSEKVIHPMFWKKYAYLAQHMGEDWKWYEKFAHELSYLP